MLVWQQIYHKHDQLRIFFIFFYHFIQDTFFYLATTFVAFRDKSDSRHVIGQGEWGKIEM
jgi:hypothetical protein